MECSTGQAPRIRFGIATAFEAAGMACGSWGQLATWLEREQDTHRACHKSTTAMMLLLSLEWNSNSRSQVPRPSCPWSLVPWEHCWCQPGSNQDRQQHPPRGACGMGCARGRRRSSSWLKRTKWEDSISVYCVSFDPTDHTLLDSKEHDLLPLSSAASSELFGATTFRSVGLAV